MKGKIMRELKKRREGLMIGAVTGAIAAYYVISQGYDLTGIINASKGLVDSLMTRSAPVEVAHVKVYGVFIFLGAGLGMLVDWLMDYVNIGKKRR